MTPDEVLAACEMAGVRLVRFLYCDNGGTVRGKATSLNRLAERMRTGIGLTVAMSAMNALDQLQPVPGLGPVGRSAWCPTRHPDHPPYAPRSAAMLCDHVGLDGQPDPVGPRPFLRRMVEALAEEGLELRAAVENEFTLAHPAGDGNFVPLDERLCFSTSGMAAAAEVTDALVDALAAQRIELEQYYPELGWGQHEVSVAPRPLLVAADLQILVRETIRAVPVRFGLAASLAPKPWPDAAGNGAHIHFSALGWRTQRLLRSSRALRALGGGRAVRGRSAGPHPCPPRPHRPVG